MTPALLRNLQALRGLAVLLVLCRHCIVIGERYGRSRCVVPELWKIGEGGVDLFFVISGFVMVLITRGRFNQPREVGTFLYQRFTRIYPLYWIYSLAIVGIYLYSPHLVNSSQGGQVDFVASFLLFPQNIMPLLGQGWTLEFEVYFYLVFAALLFAPERLLPGLLLLWGAAVAFGWNAGNESDFVGSPVWRLTASPLTIEFILGAFAGLAIARQWRRGAMLCLVAGGVLLSAGSLGFLWHSFTSLRLFYLGIPAAFIVFGAVALELQNRLRFPRWIEVIGDASYSIYISHILVISIVGRLWKTLPGTFGRPWDTVAVVLLMAASAVAFGLASYRFLECPLLRAFRERRLPRPSFRAPVATGN